MSYYDQIFFLPIFLHLSHLFPTFANEIARLLTLGRVQACLVLLSLNRSLANDYRHDTLSGGAGMIFVGKIITSVCCYSELLQDAR